MLQFLNTQLVNASDILKLEVFLVPRTRDNLLFPGCTITQDVRDITSLLMSFALLLCVNLLKCVPS